MPQVAIEFSLLSEFLGPVLINNQIAKDRTQDTLKKGPFSLAVKNARILQKVTSFRSWKTP
jgi:hypothetical protein